MIIARHMPLAPLCTLAVGGPAQWYCDASDEASLVRAINWARSHDLPIHILGGGSNVVVADAGFPGMVIRVGIRGVQRTAGEGGATYHVGAGEPWDTFVARTVAEGDAGVECLSGIPGLVGATPVQNVGAYGQDVSATITAVTALDRVTLAAHTFSNAECRFGYRTSRFKTTDRDRFVLTAVTFALTPGGHSTASYPDVVAHFADRQISDPGLVDMRDAILAIRRRKGMVIDGSDTTVRSVGSFFTNPVVERCRLDGLRERDPALPYYDAGPDVIKIPAARLIEQAGFTRGTARGRVAISPFQAQAIINRGGATAKDVLALAIAIKRAVWERFAVTLIPEPVFVGFARTPDLDYLLSAVHSSDIC